ncbi:MAG TPA: exonuclease SbcCD subunit D C-terminal domain-containing protein, partial [Myxococcota bacterium]
MRIVHTGDWHLGHTLGGFSRDAEHARFLTWLVDELERENADALFICGDVFDHGNPAAMAQTRYFDFLAAVHRRVPRCTVVVIGGNHDAAPRLDAPGPLLRSFGMHVVGAMPRSDGALDPERCLVPLAGKSGEVEAWVACVPFLRASDLPPGDDVATATGAVLGRVFDVARAQRTSAQALFALGHCHMAGGTITDDSERPVFGNAHALSVDLFPDDVTYAALGHLHFAQEVGGRKNVRYSGSPIPLSMTERAYRHQVVVVDVDGPAVSEMRALPVPRNVALLRIPEEGAPIDDVLDRLRALDVADAPDHERPFLEVRVHLDAPAPDLRARIEQALEGKAVRLVRVHREHSGDERALADAVTSSLSELDPMRVLERIYARAYGGEVPADLRAAFSELVASEA